MSETSDWAGARGEKWRAHHRGLEATMEPIHDPLFEALGLAAAARVAEVGCGCGGTALELARCAPAGTVIHGYDLSPANIEAARARGAGGAVEFHVADAGTMAPDEPYDHLLSRFGFMFFEDPVPAFRNLTRWLVPGGRLALATWGEPSENPWMTSIRAGVAELIELPEGDPAGPGPFRYADPARLVAELEAAGFRDLEVTTWRGELALGGGLPPDEAARFGLAAFGSVATALAESGEAVAAEAHARVTARLAASCVAGQVRMPAAVHLVTGGR